LYLLLEGTASGLSIDLQDEENVTVRDASISAPKKCGGAFDTLQHATYIAHLTTAFGK